MNSKTLFVLGALLLLVLGGCAKEEFGAALGETIFVNYIGSFQNGTVFDTNVQSVAEASGLQKSRFEPLRVILGTGSLIQGFEQALIGMHIGEKKKVTISPERAYGVAEPSKRVALEKIVGVNRTVKLQRDVSAPLNALGNPSEGEEVEAGDISYTVVSINNDKADIRINVELGDKIILPNTLWNSTVVQVNEDEYFVRQDPNNGSLVQTAFGPARLILRENTLIRHLLIEEGAQLRTPNGVGRVVFANETRAMIDFNHPMAGKTLIFDIELVEG